MRCVGHMECSYDVWGIGHIGGQHGYLTFEVIVLSTNQYSCL